MKSTKLSKRQKRKLRHEGIDIKQPTVGISLKPVIAKTVNQEDIFGKFNQNHLFVHGYAGTGKTYVLIYLALRAILNPNTPYMKLKIFRKFIGLMITIHFDI